MKNKNNNELYIHKLFSIDPWKIEQTKLYEGDDQLISESLTSIGNARMGMRGNFEEKFSGITHQGSYLAGV
jgi:maltose phosphorylase